MAMSMGTTGERIGLAMFMTLLNAVVIQKLRVHVIGVCHISARYRRVLVVINNLTLLHVLARVPDVQMIAQEYVVRHRCTQETRPTGRTV